MYSAVKIMVRMVKLDKGLDLGFDAKRISRRIKEYAKKARNEEELKIKVDGLIQELSFSAYSEAPVTTLAVKDRVLAHNPLGAIYSGYHLKKIRE